MANLSLRLRQPAVVSFEGGLDLIMISLEEVKSDAEACIFSLHVGTGMWSPSRKTIASSIDLDNEHCITMLCTQIKLVVSQSKVRCLHAFMRSKIQHCVGIFDATREIGTSNMVSMTCDCADVWVLCVYTCSV